ncbi:sensor histidine kinase [Terasakiella pusilla]|uniref:sensor histidine kinase n=1 Tax=Terasakiella pusilla TaxID=64973 RepID=UPI0004910759|nr:sensor histidine kinase [Terasakiella pusilla]
MTSPISSLKRRLLTWLLIPLAVMAFALVAESYFSSKKSIREIHDRMMVSMALLVSENVIKSGGDMLSEDASALLSLSSNERLYYQVLGPDGAFITGYADLPQPKKTQKYLEGYPHFYDTIYDNQPVRMMAMRFLVEGRGAEGWVRILVAQTKTERDDLLLRAVLQSAVRIVLVIGLASLLAIIGVERGLEPLAKLQTSIQKRSYNDLRPINKSMPKEISKVVEALNGLLVRLQDSIENQRRFISNASHQLRTPLAVLQAEAELALREVDDPQSIQALESILASTKQTSRLAKQLLSLTRVRGNPRGGANETQFDLVVLARDMTVEWVKRAIDLEKDLGFEAEISERLFRGSEFQIREMLSNLIDNALKYGGDEISVRVTEIDGQVALEVEDNGKGIPEDQRGQVFERFVRLDERAGEGCGLGMDIVREIVEGHDGKIKLLDGKGNQGLLVRILFP